MTDPCQLDLTAAEAKLLDKAYTKGSDGLGPYAEHGPHYSRRNPGSSKFTGPGQQIVLLGAHAVWAVVRNRPPAPANRGMSRGTGSQDALERPYYWRNVVFRNLGPHLSSRLIRSATAATARAWVERYGVLPDEPLRTEVCPKRVKSRNPGYCYQRAGWVRAGKTRRGLLIYHAPREQLEAAL